MLSESVVDTLDPQLDDMIGNEKKKKPYLKRIEILSDFRSDLILKLQFTR